MTRKILNLPGQYRSDRLRIKQGKKIIKIKRNTKREVLGKIYKCKLIMTGWRNPCAARVTSVTRTRTITGSSTRAARTTLLEKFIQDILRGITSLSFLLRLININIRIKARDSDWNTRNAYVVVLIITRRVLEMNAPFDINNAGVDIGFIVGIDILTDGF